VSGNPGRCPGELPAPIERRHQVRAAGRGGDPENEPLAVTADPESEGRTRGGFACELLGAAERGLAGEWDPFLRETRNEPALG
jgi:hypothetical protein